MKEQALLSKTSIYAGIKAGEFFSKPVKIGLGLRGSAWIEGEIDDWILGSDRAQPLRGRLMTAAPLIALRR